MTIKTGGACVTIREALLVLEACGEPLLDYTILKNDDPNFIERVIRNRVEKLGLRLDTETLCFPPGPSTLDGYGVCPVRDYVEGVVESYRPKPVAEPPRAVEREVMSAEEYGEYLRDVDWPSGVWAGTWNETCEAVSRGALV